MAQKTAAMPAVKEATAAPAKRESLEQQVQTYWGKRATNGAEGLNLLDKCIQRLAKHRDWDHLARFVVSAARHGQGDKVKKILRAAFGNKLTFKVDKKHSAGGVFVLGWQGEFDLRGSNTYGVVRAAVANGTSWDDRAFQKELPGADKKQREATEEAKKKIVAGLARTLKTAKADGFSTGELLEMVAKELAKDVVAAPVGKVEKQVVNGATVFETNF